MDNDHIVPLARQAVAILQEIRLMTGAGSYVTQAHAPVVAGDDARRTAMFPELWRAKVVAMHADRMLF